MTDNPDGTVTPLVAYHIPKETPPTKHPVYFPLLEGPHLQTR